MWLNAVAKNVKAWPKNNYFRPWMAINKPKKQNSKQEKNK